MLILGSSFVNGVCVCLFGQNVAFTELSPSMTCCKGKYSEILNNPAAQKNVRALKKSFSISHQHTKHIKELFFLIGIL